MNLNVAVLQKNLIWEDVDSNRRSFEEDFETLSPDVDLVILPELFTTAFTMNVEAVAESMYGPSVIWMQNWANNLNAVIMGSVVVEDCGRFYNRMIVARPTGVILHYDKKHLFSYSREQVSYTAGVEQMEFQHQEWTIRPIICYDLRFPEWTRNQGSYDILVCIASWPDKRIEHWDALLRARAIENQCYVLAANRIGSDASNLSYTGHSCIIDFNGKILAYGEKDEAQLHARLDFNALHLFRKRFPFLKDQNVS